MSTGTPSDTPSPEAIAEGGGETRMTIDEFAAWCRENCPHPAQGVEDRHCGAVDEIDGDNVTRFCGRHWGAVL